MLRLPFVLFSVRFPETAEFLDNSFKDGKPWSGVDENFDVGFVDDDDDD